MGATHIFHSSAYKRSKIKFSKYQQRIEEAEQLIISSPQEPGTKFLGKIMNGYRHQRILEGIRIWYILCDEMQAISKNDYESALANNVIAYKICKWCDLTCIEQLSDSLVFLKILDHDEQTKIIKNTTKRPSIKDFFP
jgi:hypothetical protein